MPIIFVVWGRLAADQQRLIGFVATVEENKKNLGLSFYPDFLSI
jgi:hypothetical protein